MFSSNEEKILFLVTSRDFNPARIHLIVPPTFRRNSRLPKAVLLHQTRLTPAELTHLRGLRVCRPLRALCDIASDHPDTIGDLRPIAAEARRRGLITEREISEMKKSQSTREFITSLFP